MALEKFQVKGAPTCRVVYPQGLFEKRKIKGIEGSEAKYNAFIIVPKNDEAKVAQITGELDKAFKELVGKGYKGKTYATINPKNQCWIDGDEYADTTGRDGFRGYYILKVASPNFRPTVADKKNLIIDGGFPIPGLEVERMSDETLNDGDYVVVNISFWTYFKPQFQGIGANIHGVKRIKAGERIGGVSMDIENLIVDEEDYSQYE